MRFSLWSVAVLVFAASLAVGAEPGEKATPEEKAAPEKKPAPQKSQPKDQGGASSSDKKGQPEGKSPKKKAPKELGIETVDQDEASLLKTLSYMQGYAVGKSVYDQFKDQGIELDDEVLLAAFKEGLSGREPKMSEEEMQKVLPTIEKYVKERLTAMVRERSMKAKAEGEAFLAENKKKEGVKTLPSGLQYKVLKSGSGETPKKSDTVKIHYKGTLLNGNEFDSSYKRGAPAPVPINQTRMKGWSEALQLMKVGDKWQIFVPPDLAYEERGATDPQGHEIIPPNATLIFDIELLGIDNGKKGRTPPLFK